MVSRRILVPVFAVALAAVFASAVPAAPPVAPRHPHFTVTNGDTLRDDYYWLREKSSPEVRAYLEAENAYTDSVMAPTRPLQEKLYDEMLSHVQETDVDVPYEEGGFFYYSRTMEGKQYPVYCRRRGSMRRPEEVVLDVNALAEGHAFMHLGDYLVSDDGNLLAFTTDDTGFRQYTLHVKDLHSGETMDDLAERIVAVAWAADNKTIFYVQEDPVTKRWYRLYRYVLGSDHHDLVYEEKDGLFDLGLYRSRSRAYIFVVAESSTTSEVWFIPADDPTRDMTSIDGRRDGHEYYVDHTGDRFFIRTNDRGRNFRLVTTPVHSTDEESWSQIWGHRENVMLEGVDCFARYYVMRERENGVPQIRVVNLKTGRSHRVDFPEPDYVVEPEDNYEFDTPRYRFVYESFVTPPSVFDYDMRTHDRTLLKEKPVPGYDRKHYESRRLYAKASDGTMIPISIVYRKDKKPKDRPMVLHGYGSYGYPLDVWFSSNRLSLLDRGVIFGVAHIRGGGELGKIWHEEGRMMNKKNTFTDFITCAEYVIKKGYTSSDKLCVTGRSAGGLLMGAVVNMRPDLFKVVVTGMPFVDMMNTMLDASLPLTTGEYLEWGNPNEKAAYDYMKSYSPYDNVGHHEYPIMLVRTSLNDSQVMYWEPTKWVAKLRATKADNHLLLLKANLEPAGHGGASGRYDRLRDVAFEDAFILTELGVEHPGTP